MEFEVTVVSPGGRLNASRSRVTINFMSLSRQDSEQNPCARC